VTQRLDPWRWVVVAAQQAVGPFPVALAAAWSAELDVVQELVAAVETGAPPRAGAAPDGALALVCLAGARLGGGWAPSQLVEAAAAVELADRAVRHHADVADRPYIDRTAPVNRRPILDGDWSITRAASLAAGIGPAAYRALVRGYGCVQLAALAGASAGPSLAGGSGFCADAGGLARAAAAMGLIVSGRPAQDFGSAPGGRQLDLTDDSRDVARVTGLVHWAAGFALDSMRPLAVSGGL
jgi:hypothetical protein